MLTMRSHSVLAPIRTGYELDDVFSVVVPLARTNIITNPSFETNTTSWSAAVGPEALTRTTAKQARGAYSLQLTPTGGLNEGVQSTWTVVNGALYAASIDFWGQSGLSYQFRVVNGSGTRLGIATFRATSRWQRPTVFFTAVTTTAIVQVLKDNSANTAAFYIDGAQLESCADGVLAATTYIDGDQQGLVPNQVPAPYLWNGTPHASTSSRSGLTRAGGRVMRFKDFGWLLTAIIGLGLATPENVATEYARIDGGFDDYTRKPSRQFTLMGRYEGMDYLQLRDNRGLAALFDRDLVGQDQRLVLLHHLEDQCGNVQSDEVRIPCKYQGGLGGNTNNQYAEETPITFTQYLPVVLSDVEGGASLTVQQSVANANEIVQRTAAGLWQALGTGGVANQVDAIAWGPDGNLYVTGNFTSMGGVANTARIAYWDGTAWHALGTGLSARGFALGFAPDGALYVGGGFATANGVVVNGIARWNGTTFVALGTGVAGASATVNALTFGPDGALYIGGDFTSVNGVANTAYIARWNGTVWSALGTGMSAGVFALVYGKDGYLYAGGTFITAGGTSASRIAGWNGTVWSALAGNPTINSTVFALGFAQNGRLFAGGLFTTIGGVSFNYIAEYNGVAWTPLGANNLNGQVNVLVVTPGGLLYAAGGFTVADGITLADRFAVWNGAIWTQPDIDLPGAPLITALNVAPSGALTLGYNTTGTATAAALTTVTNAGSAQTYPTLIVKGPSSGTSRIYQLVNFTTGRAIYLNYTINAGETAILRFEPDNLSFTSDFQGNIASTILPGSNEADFFLQPGTNIMSFFAADSSVTATLRWRPAYVSLDDVP